MVEAGQYLIMCSFSGNRKLDDIHRSVAMIVREVPRSLFEVRSAPMVNATKQVG
jgi:hypothetical protein